MCAVRAPFIWFGGKSVAAPDVWRLLGGVDAYVEPFAGSLAVLLARDGIGPVETVNDADGFIANFWRALAADPWAVERAADWPVSEVDLTARHLWLVERRADLTARLQADAEHYDAKVAGWWLWGICSWIGSGWCNGDGPWIAVDGRLVKGAGRGIERKLPHLGNAGRGINRQLPHLGNAGQGINRQLPHLGTAGNGINRGGGGEWGAHTIAARLRRVRVCCGDWRRVVTPVAADGGQRGSVGVFLDPPYTDASGEFYAVGDGSAWSEAAAWATDEADPDWRIVLAGYYGMWTPPRGWSTTVIVSKGGYQQGARSLTECLWASPSCMGGGLFGGAR